MISTLGLSVKFLKKEAYSGSHRGMRYTFKTSGDILSVSIYPEPWCLESTPENQLRTIEFPYSQDGLDSAINWLNETYLSERAYWENVDKEKMLVFLKK